MFCVKDSQRSVDTAIIGRFRKYETAVTAKRADLKMELTNGRAVNREPEIAFNHFRVRSRSHLSLDLLIVIIREIKSHVNVTFKLRFPKTENK